MEFVYKVVNLLFLQTQLLVLVELVAKLVISDILLGVGLVFLFAQDIGME
jgi:hypothetical protein